jgi:hypothetical protein
MAHVAWKLTDSSTGTGVDFLFPINPNKFDLPRREGNIVTQSTTAPSGSTLIFQGRDNVPRMSFAGVILTQAFYTDAETWFTKRYPMTLTDDQSRTWNILITSFDMERRLSATNQYAFNYTVQGLLI